MKDLLYFKMMPGEFFSDLLKKGNMLIYQSKMNPPHFKIVIDDDTYIPPKV